MAVGKPDPRVSGGWNLAKTLLSGLLPERLSTRNLETDIAVAHDTDPVQPVRRDQRSLPCDLKARGIRSLRRPDPSIAIGARLPVEMDRGVHAPPGRACAAPC